MKLYLDGLDKSRGEFNFNMFDDRKVKIQYQARYHEDSEAVHKLHYDIVVVNLKQKRQDYNTRKLLRRATRLEKTKGFSTSVNSDVKCVIAGRNPDLGPHG